MRLFSALCLLSAAGLAEAGQMSVSALALHYDSSELSSSGDTLNRESGWVPGVDGRVSGLFWRGGFWELSAEYYRGRVNYDGQTQSGRDFHSDTRMALLRSGAEAGMCLHQCRGRVSLGLAFYGRDRDIQGRGDVSGLQEEYRWQEWQLAGRWAINADQRVTVRAEVFHAANADMRLDLTHHGGPRVSLDLPDSVGYRLALHTRLPSRPWGLSLSYERLEMDASDARQVQLGGGTVLVREPASEADHWRLGVSWVLR